MTKREQIIQAIVASLAGTAGVGSRIYRSREDALAVNEAPSVIVMPTEEEAQELNTGFTNKTLGVMVSVYHRGEAPDSLADSVVESAFGKIMADTTLGGIAIDVAEGGTQWDFEQADQTAVMVNMRFAVTYRHQRNNLGG